MYINNSFLSLPEGPGPGPSGSDSGPGPSGSNSGPGPSGSDKNNKTIYICV